MLDKILEFIEQNCDWPTVLLILFLLGIVAMSFYAEGCNTL